MIALGPEINAAEKRNIVKIFENARNYGNIGLYRRQGFTVEVHRRRSFIRARNPAAGTYSPAANAVRPTWRRSPHREPSFWIDEIVCCLGTPLEKVELQKCLIPIGNVRCFFLMAAIVSKRLCSRVSDIG